jgi:hypothetical protein
MITAFRRVLRLDGSSQNRFGLPPSGESAAATAYVLGCVKTLRRHSCRVSTTATRPSAVVFPKFPIFSG